METLLDFGQEILKIREAIDSIEVKGKTNASYLVYAYDKCNEIIQAINQIVEKQSRLSERQNGTIEGENRDGKSD